MRFGRRPDAKLMKGFEQELQEVSQEYILFTSFEDDLKRLKGSLASAKQEEEVAAIKACFQEFYIIENIVRRLESHEQHLACSRDPLSIDDLH